MIPSVRKSYARNIHASEFFVSIRLKEGIPCNYEEVLNLLQTIQSGSASDGTSIQWGLTINARMEEDVRVLILAGEQEEE